MPSLLKETKPDLRADKEVKAPQEAPATPGGGWDSLHKLQQQFEEMFGYSPGVTMSNARTYRQQLVKALETKTPQGLKRKPARAPNSATLYD